MFGLCSVIVLQFQAAKCWDSPFKVLGFAGFYGLVLRQGAVGEAGALSGASVFFSPLSTPWGGGASHGPLRPADWLSWPDSTC